MIDVYFLKEYCQIWAEHEQTKWDIFKYEKGKKQVIYPLLKRPIDGNWWDITSPYGYSGPYSNDKDKKFYQEFRQAFKQYCEKNKIVSEFIRFHPLLNNYLEAKGIIPLKKRGETIWIDLTKPETTLWKNLRKGHQYSIKKAQKEKIKIKLMPANKIDEFCKLYQETMKRKQAKQYYFFPLNFFVNSFEGLKKSIFWLGAFKKENLIAGAIFLKSDTWLHYHLATTNKDWLSLSPGTLVLWEVIKLGKKMGLTKFHLGGGIDDNLSFYKQGFSNLRADFYTGEVIHNPQVYNMLCQEKKIISGDYFPLYRQTL